MSLRRRFPILLISTLAFVLTTWSLHNSFSNSQSSYEDRSQICTRDSAGSYFKGQFSNPEGILAVLLLVGGDTVQKAVAQMTGGRHSVFTPGVFSFGWVSYAVSMVASACGDAIFLPKPEQSGYVVNVGSADKNGFESLGSGDRRENRSWRLGRLMRDLELSRKKDEDKVKPKSGLFVTVYNLNPADEDARVHLKKDKLWWSFAWAIPIQLGIACIPGIRQGDWSILLITAAGNVLAIFTASLPAMRNVQYREKSRQSYALTRGNGHRHVFIIRPNSYAEDASKLPYLDELAVNIERASWAARILSFLSAVCWIMLLVAVGGLKSGTWWLLLAGTFGMLMNILVSSIPRKSAAYGLPLGEPIDCFGFTESSSKSPKRARDVLLELEQKYPGAGHALKPVFFTSSLPNKHDEIWDEPDYSWRTAKQRLKEASRGGRAASSPSNDLPNADIAVLSPTNNPQNTDMAVSSLSNNLQNALQNALQNVLQNANLAVLSPSNNLQNVPQNADIAVSSANNNQQNAPQNADVAVSSPSNNLQNAPQNVDMAVSSASNNLQNADVAVNTTFETPSGTQGLFAWIGSTLAREGGLAT